MDNFFEPKARCNILCAGTLLVYKMPYDVAGIIDKVCTVQNFKKKLFFFLIPRPTVL